MSLKCILFSFNGNYFVNRYFYNCTIDLNTIRCVPFITLFLFHNLLIRKRFLLNPYMLIKVSFYSIPFHQLKWWKVCDSNVNIQCCNKNKQLDWGGSHFDYIMWKGMCTGLHTCILCFSVNNRVTCLFNKKEI